MKMFLILKNNIKVFLFFIFSICIGFFILNYQNQILIYFFPNKIYAHRVNSIIKAKEIKNVFAGVELDVVFQIEQDIFDVNHPPANSIGLTLYNYISSSGINSNNSIWLDFKNLSKDNMLESLNRLEYLCEFLKLKKENIIIESQNSEFLIVFSENGYKTSYYLPIKLNKHSENNLANEVEKIKSKIKLYRTDYISSDVRDYSIIKNNFPHKEILTWGFGQQSLFSPRGLYRNLRSLLLKIKVLNDENVEVVLFPFYSKHGNR